MFMAWRGGGPEPYLPNKSPSSSPGGGGYVFMYANFYPHRHVGV